MRTLDHPSDFDRAANGLLRLVADHPHQLGKLRAARIVGGICEFEPDCPGHDLPGYTVEGLDLELRELVALIDCLIRARVIQQPTSSRPKLALTPLGARTAASLRTGVAA